VEFAVRQFERPDYWQSYIGLEFSGDVFVCDILKHAAYQRFYSNVLYKFTFYLIIIYISPIVWYYLLGYISFQTRQTNELYLET